MFINATTRQQISIYSIGPYWYLLACTPHIWKSGGTNFFFARSARESCFVPPPTNPWRRPCPSHPVFKIQGHRSCRGFIGYTIPMTSNDACHMGWSYKSTGSYGRNCDFSSTFITPDGSNKVQWWSYQTEKKKCDIFLAVSVQHNSVTDGQNRRKTVTGRWLVYVPRLHSTQSRAVKIVRT